MSFPVHRTEHDRAADALRVLLLLPELGIIVLSGRISGPSRQIYPSKQCGSQGSYPPLAENGAVCFTAAAEQLRDQALRKVAVLRAHAGQLLHTVLTGRLGFEDGHRLQLPESFSIGACEAHLSRIEALCRQVVEGNITAQKSHNRRLRQGILDFIAGHFDDPDLSLNYVAERFSISPRYLSAFIKEQTGRNYSDYLEQLRLQRARELLCGSRSIQEIAAGVGFTSSNTFYKCFKRRYGMSPSSYRANADKKSEC